MKIKIETNSSPENKIEHSPIGEGKTPQLRIVDAENLNTPEPKAKNRSALVQQFLMLADQIDQDIEKILQL